MFANCFRKYAAHDWAGRLSKIILDTVFPPKCVVCNRLFKPAILVPETDRPINAKTDLIDPFPQVYQPPTAYCCPKCTNAFTSISAPLCSCCGIMFKSREGQNHFCGGCITRPKKFRIARAAVASNQQLMTIIHRFKYAGKIQLAKLLGELMLNAYKRFWDRETFDLILPVPLHAKKFRKRGFNQSYLMIHSWKSTSNPLASELSAIATHTDVLIKSKETIPQTGLGRQQRLKNIKGAFRVLDPEKVVARKVLLVDDVYTTGATVNECARVLLETGAEIVDVLTVARTI